MIIQTIEFKITEVNIRAVAILFGPTFWEVVCRPQIEEWENEGGAIYESV